MKNGVAECLVGVVDVSSVAEADQNGVLARRVRRCVIGVCMIDVGLHQLSGNSSVDMANVQFHLLLGEVIGWNRVICRRRERATGMACCLPGHQAVVKLNGAIHSFMR